MKAKGTIATIVVLIIIAGIIFLITKKLIKDKKKGKSISCGGNCLNCVFDCKKRK